MVLAFARELDVTVSIGGKFDSRVECWLERELKAKTEREKTRGDG